MSTTVPYHYRADGRPCTTYGSPGWEEGQTCANGCETSRGHYANDGHRGCSEEPDRIPTPAEVEFPR